MALNITYMLITQLYISLNPDIKLNLSTSLKNLEHCIADIRLWMTQNLLFNKRNNKYLASTHCVKSVKNMWVIFDKCINMHE